jgi:hypothetical protein
MHNQPYEDHSMLLRPYILLYRKRLIASAVFSLLCAVVILFMTSAQSLTDIGVLWHHFCGCPLDPNDARNLVNPFLLTSLVLPIILGLSFGSVIAPTPSFPGETRWLLTRPTPRRALILQPLFICTLALAILPAFGWLLLLGWLKLVHAPALAHILALTEMVPSASNLGPHPSFFTLMSALHMSRRFIANLSVGLSIYAIFASQRWLLLNPKPGVRFLGLIILLLIYVPVARLVSPSFFSALLFWAPKGAGLTYLPSNVGIALHFIFAAAVLFGSWRLLGQVEL